MMGCNFLKKFKKVYFLMGLVLFFLCSCALQSQAEESGFPPAQSDSPGEISYRIISVAAVGDIMMGTENLLPPDGGAGIFTDPRPYLQGDIVFGNLEGPLTDRGGCTKNTAPGRAYCFRTPPAYVSHLKDAGFNIVSIANNHSNDYGPLGREQTKDVLTNNGIGYTGEPGQITVLELKDNQKAVFIGLAPNQGCQNINDIPAAVSLVKKAKADYPQALIMVSMHGGAEGTGALQLPLGPELYLGEKRGDLRNLAFKLIDAGAALIIGHGPHVPRAVEVYKDRLIIYSLGNFATASGINVKAVTGLAPLIQVRLNQDGSLIDYKIVSFRQKQNQGPKSDPTDEAAKLIAKLSADLQAKVNAKDQAK
jgi:hypothetical protein